MKSFIANSGIEIPYLSDKEKVALKTLGGKRCPEVFVITPANWNVVYSGAIDNNPQVASDVSESYLTLVLDEVIRGSKVSLQSKRPTGCIIK